MTDLTALMLEEAEWERAAHCIAVLRDLRPDRDTRDALLTSARLVDQPWKEARAALRTATDAALVEQRNADGAA